LQDELKKTNNELNKTLNEKGDLQLKNADLVIANERLDKEIEGLNKELESTLSDKDNIQKKLDQTNKSLSNALNDKKTLELKNDELTKEKNEALKDVKKQANENKELRDRVQYSRDNISNLEKQLDTAKKDKEEFKKDNKDKSISLEYEVQDPNSFYIDNSHQNSLDALKRIQEIEKINHENIFADFSVVKDYTRIRVFYPITDHKNLVQYLKSKPGQLEEAEVRRLIGQLLKGYELLYNKKMCHGNIQPKTLIMEGEVLKLHLLARTGEFKLQNFSVDMNYIAPELLINKDYNTTADIWSIGVITYYMLHGRPLFDVNKKDAYQEEYIMNASLSQLCMDFLSCCLQENYNNRMSFEEIKSHPFVTDAMEGWELVKPNPYSKSKWLCWSEYKCNIQRLIRGIGKPKGKILPVEILGSTKTSIMKVDKIMPLCESCIAEEGKDAKFGTRYGTTYRDAKIRKFSL